MEKIEWDEKLSVDIPEIDELQKKLFALINALIDLMESNAEKKECANMISEISEYSKYFFSIEEEYLKRNKYPEFIEHSKMHRKFESFVMDFRRLVADDKNNLNDEIVTELKNLLTNHIKTFDLKFVPFLRINSFTSRHSKKGKKN
ncbi:MAG: hemerythrin family protein [Desulfobacteraceae bacterium]|nr:hemerythrin family protein [Desulfobacteraceae bacterium]